MPEERETAAPQPAPTIEPPAPAESSPATTPSEGAPATPAPVEPTVESIVKDVLAAHEETASPAETETKEESLAPSGDKTEKTAAGTEPQPQVEAKEGPVPYSRFKEVNDKVHAFEQELAQAKPLLESARATSEYLRQHGVTQEEYQDVLNTLVLLKTDPKAGLAKLKPVYDQLSQFDENRLPPEYEQRIQKLRDRVEEGELSKQAAEELESAWRSQARLETQQKLGQRQSQMSEADRQKAYVESFTTAASQWDVSRRTTDPDYKPKTKPDAPDGVFELTQKGFMWELGKTQVKTPQDVVNLLETAYKDAKNLFSTYLKQGNTKPAPTTRGSTTIPRKEPTTDEEVVREVLRQHGIPYVPRASA